MLLQYNFTDNITFSNQNKIKRNFHSVIFEKDIDITNNITYSSNNNYTIVKTKQINQASIIAGLQYITDNHYDSINLYINEFPLIELTYILTNYFPNLKVIITKCNTNDMLTLYKILEQKD